MLVERCRDPALSVRKQAMQSLTDLLLSMPAEKPLQKLVLQYMDMYHCTAIEHSLLNSCSVLTHACAVCDKLFVNEGVKTSEYFCFFLF